MTDIFNRNKPITLILFGILAVSFCSTIVHSQNTSAVPQVFLAGAATSNITPGIGSSINGNTRDIRAKNIHDETFARSIVLDDGRTCLAFVIMDLCKVTRETLDKAKARAHQETGIPVDNMLMSATHTHEGGTAVSVFQSEPDPAYLNFLAERAADALIRAYRNRVPARIGWAVGHEPNQVFNRRWKMKQGTPMPDPFGGQDLVITNPGVGNPNLLEPAGGTDPEVPVIAIQSLDGRPIAVLSNYSLHYVGRVVAGDISADYFGMFATRIKELLGAGDPDQAPFVGIMTNGNSADIENTDWTKTRIPEAPYTRMRKVSNILAAEVYKTIQRIQYKDWVSLAAVQTEISLGVRKPDKKDIARAENIVSHVKGPEMISDEEVYARETLLMKDFPSEVPVILQAFRIGDLAITAIPVEVFVETGLYIKAKSLFKPTFTIELANGYNGYLPPPAQHKLGGYETWRARSSYLEVEAEPKITKALFELLNKLENSKQSGSVEPKK